MILLGRIIILKYFGVFPPFLFLDEVHRGRGRLWLQVKQQSKFPLVKMAEKI